MDLFTNLRKSPTKAQLDQNPNTERMNIGCETTEMGQSGFIKVFLYLVTQASLIIALVPSPIIQCLCLSQHSCQGAPCGPLFRRFSTAAQKIIRVTFNPAPSQGCFKRVGLAKPMIIIFRAVHPFWSLPILWHIRDRYSPDSRY